MSTGIGLRICNRRKELGWSQDDLASRMGLKSKSTICKVERGEDNLTADSVQKYANALGVPSEYLVGNEDINGNKTVRQLLLEVQSEDEEFLELYRNADPEIRNAVATLLKSSKRNP